MKNRSMLLGLSFFFVFIFCFSINVAAFEWHDSTFGASVTVEEPPSPSIFEWHDSSFGVSVTVEGGSPSSEYIWLDESFGASIIVEGWSYGNWSDWWVLYNYSTPVISGVNPSNNSIGSGVPTTDWNCTIENPDGYVFDWTIEASNGDSNSGNDDTNGSKTLSLSSLSYGETITVWVNVSHNETSDKDVNEIFYFTTTTGLDITNPNPANNSNSVSYNQVNVSVYISDPEGDTFNWSIESYPDIGSNSSNGDSNGTKQAIISGNLSYQTVYTWYVNATDGDVTENKTYVFTVEDLNTISGLSIANWNSSAINLSWSKNSNVTTTYIRYSIAGNSPSSIINGVFLVNTSDTFYNHSGLNYGTKYSYSLWSYNSSSNVFSNSKATGFNYTNPGSPSSLQDTDSGMNSIEFQWDVGTNATRSVVFINASGETGFPNRNNGTEVINTTGNSGTVSGLSVDTLYYFMVISYNPASGLWSEGNSTDNATTLASAGAISNLNAARFNHNQLNLSWTKANSDDDTVILRKTGSYPTGQTDGTVVYNGSLLTYKDTGLTPATKYYYRAWGWNGESFSTSSDTDSEITRPQPPQNFTGDIVGSDLVMTWNKGIGAARTVIRNNTGSYPTLSTGYLRYNNTGTTNTSAGVGSIDYYRGWSYVVVSGEGVFSLGQDLLWGGIEINVYKEDNPSIAIGNYTVFITNNDASETYENTSQSNPFRIDVSDVPNGEDITIQIQKDGYKTRSQTIDLFENTYYTVDFYLPASSEGSPSDESGEPWYVNGSDPDNETLASHYIITVEDTSDEPVGSAYIVIEKYINTSDSYEPVVSDYSDSSGQVEVDLIPDTVYYVTITKDSYETMTAYWTPSEISYVEDAYKTFVLTPESEDYTNETSYSDCIVFTAEKGGSTGYVNLSNSGTNCGTLSNFSIWVYEINLSTNETTFYTSHNETSGNQNYNMVFTMNISNNYWVRVFLNHSVFGNVWDSKFIINYESPGVTSVDEFENFFDTIFGDSSIAWSGLFGLFVLMACLFAFGQRAAGLSLILTGFVMLGVGYGLGLVLLDASICITIIVFGILAQWKIERSVKR